MIHDTLAGTKTPLTLLEPGRCGIYCCGPTVYDMSHIGHARAALLPDVLVRFLRHQGIEVRYVRNITDIDDKIIRRAAETGADPGEIARRFTAEYHADLDAMGLLRPDVEPKVTEHIDGVVSMIAALVERGMAYVVEGDVYFSVPSFTAYGRLSKRDPQELRAGARVEVDNRKRDAADFALWKAAKPGEPAWESPWGPGRPGWHIECSAMSVHSLGPTFDLHCGGQDLIFPHHENEIAQSQGCHGPETYARHWIHNGFVKFAGEKMSKSLGNFFTIREVTRLYHPEVLRFFLLGSHYRRGVNFEVEVTCPSCRAPLGAEAQESGTCDACGHTTTPEILRQRIRFPGLEEADERVAYIYETLLAARAFVASSDATDDGTKVADEIEHMEARVVEALRDDLNTAAALAELSEPLAAVNRLLASGKGVNKTQRKRTIARFVAAFERGRIPTLLGLFERDPSGYLEARRNLKAQRIGLDVARVEALIEARWAARAAQDWAKADSLRASLDELGVKLRDGATGTTWTL